MFLVFKSDTTLFGGGWYSFTRNDEIIDTIYVVACRLDCMVTKTNDVSS